jgi:ankyrin repeat protein
VCTPYVHNILGAYFINQLLAKRSTMSLITLPNELIQQIVAELDSQKYFNNIVRTCRFFHESFNDLLYEHEIRRDGGHAVMLYAAQMGQTRTIHELLRISANSTQGLRLSPNPPLPKSWSPLLWSAIRGDEDMAKLLLSMEDIDVDIRYPKKRTPLSIAAELGFVGVVRLLLAAGADPNTKDDLMRTPLHWAGSPQLAGESCASHQQNWFRKDAQNPKRNLHCPLAVYFEQDIIGSELWNKEEGKRMEHSSFPDDTHWKPLIQPNLTSALWSAGSSYEEILNLHLQYGAQLELTDDEGRTPLLWAAACGYRPLVQLLLDSSIALQSLEPVKKLSKTVQEGINRNTFLETETDDDSQLALSYAAQNGHLDTVQFLVERATQRDSLCNDPGWAPLVSAAREGHVDIVKFLLSVHSQRWPEQSLGSAAMIEAARRGKTEIIPLLIEAGAKFEGSGNPDLMNPLHFAAMNMHVDTVRFLLDIPNVDVNTPDKHGWTALDWTARGQIGVRKYMKDDTIKNMLLDRGASPSSLTREMLDRPPHYFLWRGSSGCTFGPCYGSSYNPVSFRCDWDSLAQGKKMRDLPYSDEIADPHWTPPMSEEMRKAFEGWSYNRPLDLATFGAPVE